MQSKCGCQRTGDAEKVWGTDLRPEPRRSDRAYRNGVHAKKGVADSRVHRPLGDRAGLDRLRCLLRGLCILCILKFSLPDAVQGEDQCARKSLQDHHPSSVLREETGTGSTFEDMFTFGEVNFDPPPTFLVGSGIRAAHARASPVVFRLASGGRAEEYQDAAEREIVGGDLGG